MSLTAFLHGYPPFWSMGGETSTHRTLRAVPGSVVFAQTDQGYLLDGVTVLPLPGVTSEEIEAQAIARDAEILFAHSALATDTVRAARRMGAYSILAVHAPPQFAKDLRRAWSAATVRLYNTEEARRAWADNRGWVLHPPVGHGKERLSGSRDALTLTSSLVNKGVERVLALAAVRPDRRFIIVESPAHGTHGDPYFWDWAASLPNVEVWPRLHPDEMHRLWGETDILLAPSRYETYGMSAVEAARYGIPSVHVDTPHVREGIGDAAYLLQTLEFSELVDAVKEVENHRDAWSSKALERAEALATRERGELAAFVEKVAQLPRL